MTGTPDASRDRTISVVIPSRPMTGAVICARPPAGLAATVLTGPAAYAVTAAAAAARSAPGASTSVSRSSPILALSASGVPAAITWPASMTAIWSASWSASSRYCVVSRSVVHEPASSWMISHITERLRGSSPVVGSSRNSTSGRPMRLAARSSRRRIPPE